ncbi:MAG: PepSY domain-containing protein [Hyphomicrobium sp.]
MKRLLATAALIGFTGTAALAETTCSVPKAEWQPEQVLRDKLTAKQWTVKNIKTDEGCYEVYGTDDKGKRFEIYFNPKTLEPIEGNKG